MWKYSQLCQVEIEVGLSLIGVWQYWRKGQNICPNILIIKTLIYSIFWVDQVKDCIFLFQKKNSLKMLDFPWDNFQTFDEQQMIYNSPKTAKQMSLMDDILPWSIMSDRQTNRLERSDLSRVIIDNMSDGLRLTWYEALCVHMCLYIQDTDMCSQ